MREKEVRSEPGHLPTCRLGLLSRLVSDQASSSALPEARGLLSPGSPGRDRTRWEEFGFYPVQGHVASAL